MCGIAGIIWPEREYLHKEQTLINFIAAQEKRGPDESGFFYDDFIGLAHNRLSIIDPGNASQPFYDKSQGTILIFNGEIFNFNDFRQELINDGYPIRYNSDTEIFYYLLNKYDEECLNNINGQFSFAFYKPKDKTLLLARDPIGEKPLYYYNQNDYFIFSSEVKGIQSALRQNLELSVNSLQQNNLLWANIPSRSAFKYINSLPAGSLIKISEKEFKIENYFKFNFKKQDLDASDSEVKDMISQAVSRRLISDAPVGVYLSGGIDSAIIAYEMSNKTSAKINSFSLSFSNKSFDELNYQIETSKYLGTNHEVLEINDEDIILNFENALSAAESPSIRSGFIGMFLLNKKLNENKIKVALSGEGADEIFMGYDIFRENVIKMMIREGHEKDKLMPLIKSLNSFLPNNDDQERFLGTKYLNYKNLSAKESFFSSHSERINLGAMTSTFIKSEKIENEAVLKDWEKYFKEKYDDFEKFDELKRCQIIEIETLLTNHLLSIQGDRVSMGNSIETRPPFLDVELFKNIINLKRNRLIDPKILTEKKILKDIYLNKIPDNVISRNKFPYRAPDSISFFNEKGKEYINDNLSSFSSNNSNLDIEKFKNFTFKLLNKGKFSPRENHTFMLIFSAIIIEKIFCNQNLYSNRKFNYHLVNQLSFDNSKLCFFVTNS